MLAVTRRFSLLCILAATVLYSVGCRKNEALSSDSGSLADSALTSEQAGLDQEPSEATAATEGTVPAKLLSLADRQEFVERLRPSTEAFCGDCHSLPRPKSSPVDEWEMEVEQGFRLYVESGRTDLQPPNQADVVKFFQYQAPDELDFSSADFGAAVDSAWRKETSVRSSVNFPPGITHLKWIDLGVHDSPAIVSCDIGSGQINAVWPYVEGQPTEVLATLFQPVHIEPCDLDGDGVTELIAGDIGEFDATDSDVGRVVWLRRKAGSLKLDKVVLLDGYSRISDVRPGDFDGDGDVDLIVAAFGWRKTGEIVLLVNEGFDDAGQPVFESRKIDDRHGPVHVPPVDLNQDGHLDFVALIGQDHEAIVAFLNDGTGHFESQTIWRAPDPAYGSCGIEMVDIDSDDDLDVLYINGDSFDRGAKPHHSIQWLENEGGFPFTHHHLTYLPGVMSAKVVDMDNDGDFDILASTLIASEPASGSFKLAEAASLVLLTQTTPGEFERANLEAGNHQHLTLETGDFNGDGKVDFATGHFVRSKKNDVPDLSIWLQKP